MTSGKKSRNLESHDEIIQESAYAGMNTIDATDAILRDFNQGRESIMTNGYNWLFKHRMVMPNEFRLVEKNGVPELVGHNPVPQRRKKILNFQDSSSTIGMFKQSTLCIGANGHYVMNVPPGKYAKIFDGNKAVLLGSGQHVIHSNNFSFDKNAGLVDQINDYIMHNDLHILRVPQGKVAVVRVNNETMFLEHRKEPYLFRQQQFKLIKAADDCLFHPGNAKMLHAGTNIRLLPDAGEVGVLNIGGNFRIIRPEKSQVGPINEDIGNARFDGFLATSLQNVEFPSEAVRLQHEEQGIGKDLANFDYFYTADQVKVGVRFLVNFKIDDPELALSMLKLKDIRAHIESVVTADMGNAIKKTSMQDLLSSDLSRIHEKDSLIVADKFNHWQDEVKTKLRKDLAEYGITLMRLNIEEAKILNPEIEQQMSQQAIAFASAHAQRLALQANLEIKQQEAEQKRVLATQQQEADSAIGKIQAEAQVNIAKLQAEAVCITTNAEVYSQKEKAKVLESSPQAMLISFLTLFGEALRNGHFSSALPLSDLRNLMTTFMSQITQVVNNQSVTAEGSACREGFFKPEPLQLVSNNQPASAMS